MRKYTSSGNGSRTPGVEFDGDDGHGSQMFPASESRSRRGGRRHAEAAAGLVDRKAWQLCRQVGHTLDEVLAECGDPVLQGLRVESVEPCPDAARLLVTVAFIDDRPAQMADAGLVVDRLQRASGHLHYEVATAVTRKRTRCCSTDSPSRSL